KFTGSNRKIFSDAAKRPTPLMRWGSEPVLRFLRCFYGVPNIFSISHAGFRHKAALGISHCKAVPAIGWDLFSPNIVCRRAIDELFCLQVAPGRADRSRMKVKFMLIIRRQRTLPAWNQIFVHSLVSTFPGKTAFPIAPETRRGIKKACRVDPD